MGWVQRERIQNEFEQRILRFQIVIRLKFIQLHKLIDISICIPLIANKLVCFVFVFSTLR